MLDEVANGSSPADQQPLPYAQVEPTVMAEGELDAATGDGRATPPPRRPLAYEQKL